MRISFFILLISPAIASAFSYTVLPISPSDPTTVIDTTSPLLLNNLGEVAGTYDVYPGPLTGQHGFRTQPNSPLNVAADDIGPATASGDPTDRSRLFSSVIAMNNLGQIVAAVSPGGTAVTDSSGKVANSVSGLPASFINDNGQLAGVIGSTIFRTQPSTPDIYNPATDNLGSFGPQTTLYGINNGGQVIGNSLNGAFRTAPDAVINSATDGLGPDFRAFAINDAGAVAGNFGSDPTGEIDAYFVGPTEISPNGHNLGTLVGMSGAAPFATANDVNDEGVVVGYSNAIDHTIAFVTLNGVMTDLNTVVDPSFGLPLTDALQINDNGQILALSGGGVFLLTPIPEPTSLTLLGTFALLLARRRNRQVR